MLRERVVDPIGCSPDWTCHGYAGAEVDCAGVSVRSVSGGGHRGGGMFIGCRDHTRMGQLVLQGGVWDERHPGWGVGRATDAPGRLGRADHGALAPRVPLRPAVLAQRRPPARYPGAAPDGAFALGAGSNLVWVAPGLDLVAVVRWIDGAAVDGLLGRLIAAIRP